nr:nitrate- and nitrite sensing domain-containing protein [Streptomyces sp. NWU339]
MPTRLNAILFLPVVVCLVMGTVQIQGSFRDWQAAVTAGKTARVVEAAFVYGHRLQEERDVSVEPLLRAAKDDQRVVEARVATDKAAEDFHAVVEDAPETETLNRRLDAFLEQESKLDDLRAAAYTGALKGVETEEGYLALQHPLLELSNELGPGTTDVTGYGRTLYAISMSKSAISLQRAIGMHLLVNGPDAADAAEQRVALTSYAYLEGIATHEYLSGGREEDITALEEAQRQLKAEAGTRAEEAAAEAKANGEESVAPPAPDKALALLAAPDATRATLAAQAVTPESWWATTTAEFEAYRTIETELIDNAVKRTSDLDGEANREAIATATVVLVGLLVTSFIAGLMARQMSRSMLRLRSAALDVAEQRLPMLVDQLSRTDPGRVDTRVEPIPITTTDEIGEVARAFDQVHREAVRLAAEQALLRGNVNAIFTNLSRRNQSLIEGQLTLITDLENNEADPDQLEHLFKLDHLATRMRRNGENLLVLAGEEPGRRWDQPIPLVDVLRAAASEVEQYERVELAGVPEAEIHGRAVSDLVHLLAELMENATTFSSPQNKVLVAATRLPDGRIMIEIHDKGIGLTPEDFADINHRLAKPPIVDAEISQHMGLYVVGRLSGRHGIRVQLRPSGEQAGTTSLVMLPEAITHGGGGDQVMGGAEFTVASIIPEQQSHEAPPQRTAAELGFDDSRYTADGPQDLRELDPVGRSLLREELRAALEATQNQRGGGRPAFREEARQPSAYQEPGPYQGRQPGHPAPVFDAQAGAYGARSAHDGSAADYGDRESHEGAGGHGDRTGHEGRLAHDGQYVPVQNGHHGDGYPADGYREQRPPTPDAYTGRGEPSHRGEWQDSSGYGNAYMSTSGTEAATGPGGAESAAEHAGFPPPAVPSTVHEVTDVGLPRRNSAAGPDDATHRGGR